VLAIGPIIPNISVKLWIFLLKYKYYTVIYLHVNQFIPNFLSFKIYIKADLKTICTVLKQSWAFNFSLYLFMTGVHNLWYAKRLLVVGQIFFIGQTELLTLCYVVNTDISNGLGGSSKNTCSNRGRGVLKNDTECQSLRV